MSAAARFEAVEAAKTSAKPRAAGMVNAVLRRIAELRLERLENAPHDADDVLVLADGSGWRLSEPLPGRDDLSRLAAQGGMHVSVLERWAAMDGLDVARQRALHSIVEPPVIIRGEGIEGTPHDEPGFTLIEPGTDIAALLHDHPDAAVQDPASASAVASTAGLSPALIIDPCAGRGTKSIQLATLHPDATVLAADVHPGRAQDLLAAAQHQANLSVAAFKALGKHAQEADLLLLDVPCTNTAVLPRRPEARHRLDRKNRRTLQEKQRQIAANTMALLAPGGHLLWSTCSLDAQENQQQVDWLMQYHPLDVVSQTQLEPRGLPGDPPTTYRDGAFHALLKRRP